MIEVAALFVEVDGVYAGRDGVDVWGLERDARSYRGPHAVVAHPPCKRWGRYWHGGPSARQRRILGDDDGCFAAALWAVRTFGGVLEHPEASHAWAWFGLPRPLRSGGWSNADKWGGRACCVEQGHYGHRARKATWLYLVAPRPFGLVWGPSAGARLDQGCQTREIRLERKAAGTIYSGARLTAAERIATPPAFAEVLIEMARSVEK